MVLSPWERGSTTAASLGVGRPGTGRRPPASTRGYGGPDPPDREHSYRFRAYALDATIDLDAGATNADLVSAMQGHVLDQAELHGTYAP
jgi:Raf kinase inhibitor-like YbhB/YbcL family protein